jgi:hypothetical protein
MASSTDLLARQRAPKEDGASDLKEPGLSERKIVTSELESILSSPFFRTTRRSKQFLEYVVRYKLEGHPEPLKERTIGADLFQRPAGYATGEDAVVRVQAGEVRRRLEQYYHSAPSLPIVRIDLPVGSYTPEFIWTQNAPSVPLAPQPSPPPALPVLLAEDVTRRRRTWPLWALLGIVVVLVPALLFAFLHRQKAPKSALAAFWSPAFTTSEPILICLAEPVVYRPDAPLYQRHAPPGKFKTEAERLAEPPPLKAGDTLTWRDMSEYPEFGVARGDAYAAIQLSLMLNQIGKQSQTRIGNNYSFEDLRSFPAIVVGAFNNRWTMQITSNLHFTFFEDGANQVIREQGSSGRAWRIRYVSSETGAPIAEDYGLVTRLMDSRTGQFVVTVAGITSDGTQAASEFVTGKDDLEKALRNAPPGWDQKNLQIVVRTTVTDSIPGPPQVVATYFW